MWKEMIALVCVRERWLSEGLPGQGILADLSGPYSCFLLNLCGCLAVVVHRLVEQRGYFEDLIDRQLFRVSILFLKK